MTDSDRALDAIERASAELLPQLTERLVRHGLGEIEISSGELRMRVAASSAPKAEVHVKPATVVSTTARSAAPPNEISAEPGMAQDAPAPPQEPGAYHVSSPAVGFFVYGDGLGPGLEVDKGDALGYVEMLGVRHDVRAPRRGTVRNLVAESGEPVEYGQVVLELAPAEGER